MAGATGATASPEGVIWRLYSSESIRGFDGREAAADAFKYDVEAVTLGQHRVHERPRDVDPAAARLQHPLDELLHLPGAEHQVGQLVPAVAGDEDAARVVDPDLLDRRVVEERLER